MILVVAVLQYEDVEQKVIGNPEDTDRLFLCCTKFKMHISQDEREFVCLQNMNTFKDGRHSCDIC
jgi:hypothetical protein